MPKLEYELNIKCHIRGYCVLVSVFVSKSDTATYSNYRN